MNNLVDTDELEAIKKDLARIEKYVKKYKEILDEGGFQRAYYSKQASKLATQFEQLAATIDKCLYE